MGYALSCELIVGSELRSDDGLHVVVLARTRAGYGPRVITRAQPAAPKGPTLRREGEITLQRLTAIIHQCLGTRLGQPLRTLIRDRQRKECSADR